MTNSATIDLSELEALKVELDRLKNARVKVGILGSHAERFDADWNREKLNNPTLGLIHEFGTKSRAPAIPARSWLRMPLMLRLPGEVDKIGRAVWRALVFKRGLLVALKDLGALAENVIQRAFETGGFGQWKPLARSTIRRKGSAAILIETGYLRKAVSSAVVERSRG